MPPSGLFDAQVRNHLAGDLAEAREPVGNADEAIVVEPRDVAGDIPAVAQALPRFAPAGPDSRACGSVPSPAAGPSVVRRQRLEASPDPRSCAATPGSGCPTVPGLCPTCVSSPVFEVRHVDRDHRRHFRAAVSFQQLHAELLAKAAPRARAASPRPPARSRRVAKSSGSALARVGGSRTSAWKAGTSRDTSRTSSPIAFASVGFGMIHHAAAGDQREPDRHRESEGVEERQHARQCGPARRSRTPARSPRCSRAEL